MNTPKNLAVPQPTIKDVAYSAGEALANILPFAGPELFRLILSSPLENRRNKWMEEISKALQELYDRSQVNIAELNKNEEFISFIIQTSKIALGQHEEEKLNYLKNSLLNSLLLDISYDVKCAFINAVDQLSPRHILILRLMKEVYSNRGAHITEKSDVINDAASRYFNGDSEIAAVFFDNLFNLKLITNYNINPTFNKNREVFSYYLPTWGKKFLEFISEPEYLVKD